MKFFKKVKCERCKSKKDVVKCDVHCQDRFLISENLCGKCRNDLRVQGLKVVLIERIH